MNILTSPTELFMNSSRSGCCNTHKPHEIDLIDDFLDRELQDWIATADFYQQPMKTESSFTIKNEDEAFPEPYPFTYPSLSKVNQSREDDLTVFLDNVVMAEENTGGESMAICSSIHEKGSDDQEKEVATARHFRTYQEVQWQEMYRGLLEYIKKHGHCCVPNKLSENPRLGRWVKRQRYQYKLLQQGKQSTLTAARVELLDEVGFVWDSHKTLWVDRLTELKEFRSVHGHCNVPSTYPQNVQLSTWVKCQRRQHKLYLRDKKQSNLTEERVETLSSLGFEWDGRKVRNSTGRLFGKSA